MKDAPTYQHQQDRIVFQSELPYNAQRIRAAAVYCSDGRFGKQCDDFLHNALALPRYDRLIIPGGPVSLADYYAVHWEGDALVAQIRFLVERHSLTRLVLIAHENCAFYTERLHVGQHDLIARQQEDLNKAAIRIRESFPSLAVDAFFAGMGDDRVYFERVPLRDELRDMPRTAWIESPSLLWKHDAPADFGPCGENS